MDTTIADVKHRSATPATPDATPIRLVLTYRVLFHWRTPVFQRLARTPGIDFVALHGSDFPGTKAVNSKNPSGFAHRELLTLKPPLRARGDVVPMPICPTLPAHLARLRPDVILCEGGSNLLNNLLVFAYAVPTRTPVVWWTLGELRNRGPRSTIQRAFDAIIRWMERHSASLLGYSSLAIRYFDREGYPKAKQFRAVNCIDTDREFQEIERALPRVDALRRSLHLDGKTVLLYVGAMAPSKRLEDLITVYGHLRKRHSDLRLLLVGDGSHRPALERFARENDADDTIFAGQVLEGISAYFLLGDVFVLPGLGGLAISQAMTHGLPVIATEADGCEIDLIEEDGNGHLLPVGDCGALERCLEDLLSNPDKRKRFGDRSRWLIENRYNIGAYMQNVIAAVRHAARS